MNPVELLYKQVSDLAELKGFKLHNYCRNYRTPPQQMRYVYALHTSDKPRPIHHVNCDGPIVIMNARPGKTKNCQAYSALTELERRLLCMRR
jgi:hypothetical protein